MMLDAVSHGFGKSRTLLHPSQVFEAEKVSTSIFAGHHDPTMILLAIWLIQPREQGAYLADILFLLSHGTAKASVFLLLRRLHRETVYKRICDGLLVATAAWALGSVLAVALKCGLSHPWLQDRKCYNVVRSTLAFFPFFFFFFKPWLMLRPAVSPMVDHYRLRRRLRSDLVHHEYLSHLGTPDAPERQGHRGRCFWVPTTVSPTHPSGTDLVAADLHA
jgi:hypothetical protein